MPDQNTDEHQQAIGVHVRNMQLGWNARVLVEGLSFEASANSWTCLLGESGVGKTTLLRTIAHLIPAFRTTQITSSTEENLEGKIAYMAQQDLLLPWLTAIENVVLGKRLRGEFPDLKKAASLLERTGITDRNSALPSEMSGGERQRAALARTLMEDSPVVLMDEPFSSLDAITRNQLQELAFDLLSSRTVLMVTHDPFEALRLAKKIHIIQTGKNDAQNPIIPPGTPLRDPTDPSLRETYQTIMSHLSQRPSKV